jgi:ATP-dependent RNA helicase RhlE
LKFTEFNLSETLLAGLRDIQFTEPTAIQEKAIPIVTAGKDLIATAQTGTGKTGAFIIPIMERVLQSERKGVKALIISPTRELASQIDEQIFAIGYHAGITSATVIGGSDFSVQAKALKAGVDIIVATPGRLIDQNKVVGIDFSNLEYLVLDEADRMLDMGFMPDIKKIISWLPDKRQTLLFSATMPGEIKKLASTIMKNPESVAIERSKPSQSVEQRAYTLRSNQKVSLVKKIFKSLTWESCIIFTSTKKGTDELHRLLKKEGIKSASIHGDRTQDERNRALNDFKNGKVPVIVATDVLARGIDIKGVSIIINYDVPNNTDDYIHRIGRTGRYDKSGIAITFVTRRDSRIFQTIEDIKGNSIKKIDLPESFGERSEFSWGDDFTGKSSELREKPKPQIKSEDKQERSGKSAERDNRRKSDDDKEPKKKAGSSTERPG